MESPPGYWPVQSDSPMNNAPLPVTLDTHQQRRVVEKYDVKSVKSFSIMQIILGYIAIIFQFITAGSLGVLSSKTRRPCAIISFLVMSILALVLTIVLLVFSSINISVNIRNRDSVRRWQIRAESEMDRIHKEDEMERLDKVIILAAILLLISLTEAVAAIISSCYACHGLCNSTSQQGNVPMQGQVQYIPGPNGQTQILIIPMQSQPNVMTANLPPYQLTTPVLGYQTQPPASHVETPGGHGVPLSMLQLHHAHAAAPPHPPMYSQQTTPPPEYEEKEKSTSE